MPEHGDRQQCAAGQQQRRLGDLDPGGGLHAANRDVKNHESADASHRHEILHAKQQLDDFSGADHLRDQIEQHDDETTGGRDQADRRSLKTERRGIREREAAEIAHPFRHHEQNDRPTREEADRIKQSVEAVGIEQGGDAEKCCRGEKISGDRQAVLQRRDRMARSVEICFRFSTARRPIRNHQGDEDDQHEHADRDPIRPALVNG